MPNPIPPNPSRPALAGGERPRRLKFPMRVRRLRLRYADNGWETLTDVLIERKTLRQAPVLPAGPRAGFCFELRDAQGKLLYWGKAANPLTPSLELFEADGSIRRVPFKRKEAFVEVLIPDLPEAAELEIFSDVSPDGEVQKHATMIRGVSLADGKTYGKDGKGDDHGRR